MRAPRLETEPSDRHTSEPPRQVSITNMLLGAFAFVVIIGLIAAIFRDGDRLASSERVVGVDAIAAAPDAYYGKTVTIAGDVADVYGPRMFTLDEDTIGAGADLLVLVKEPVPGAREALDDAEVTVTGTVRPFTRTELARDYEWIDESWFADRDLSAAERLPVVIAESASLG